MNHLKRALPLVAVAVIAGLSACGGDDEGSTSTGHSITENTTRADSTTAKPAIATIVVKGGKPVGGVQEFEYTAGELVRFQVRSDAAEEVHVHGYDVEKEVPAGGTATLVFPADIEGIFEVELHESEEQIAELRVNP